MWCPHHEVWMRQPWIGPSLELYRRRGEQEPSPGLLQAVSVLSRAPRAEVAGRRATFVIGTMQSLGWPGARSVFHKEVVCASVQTRGGRSLQEGKPSCGLQGREGKERRGEERAGNYSWEGGGR